MRDGSVGTRLDRAGETREPGVRSEGSQLQRGLLALDALAQHSLTAADVARRLNINRSTALRLLRDLERAGYAVRDPISKRYRANAERFYALIISHEDHAHWSASIEPLLSSLQQQFGEAAMLGVPANGSMVYMAYFPSSHIVGVREHIGATRSMHASALGKAYLSGFDPVALDSELGRLSYTGGTEHAAKGPLELRKRIDEARAQGYTVDQGETFEGVSCVAAPLRIRGEIKGAVGVSGPSTRLTIERLHRIGERLVDALLKMEGR